jgi:hypothetical protein
LSFARKIETPAACLAFVRRTALFTAGFQWRLPAFARMCSNVQPVKKEIAVFFGSRCLLLLAAFSLLGTVLKE